MNELYRETPLIPLLLCDMEIKEGRSETCPAMGLIIFWNDGYFAMRVFAGALGHYIGVIT